MGLGGDVCGVFPGRRLLILEATIGRRRGVKREELAALDRGSPLFADSLTSENATDEGGER